MQMRSAMPWSVARLRPAGHDPGVSIGPAYCGENGGGGNRTRVRRRTGWTSTSVGCLGFRPPAGDSRPIDELAILWCRASGDWLSLGAEPVFWHRYPSHGPSSERCASLWFRQRERVRRCSSHLRFVPVVLRGRPGTSACSSTGESTTSKPDRPRMCVLF